MIRSAGILPASARSALTTWSLSAKDCSRLALRDRMSALRLDEPQTTSAVASAHRSAGNEDYAESDVNDVIHLAEHQHW